MKNPLYEGVIRDWNKGGTDDRQNTKPEPLRQYRVICESFRAFQKNTLQGFAVLLIEPPGLSIQGCTAHSQGDRRWVGLPSRQYKDDAGVTKWQPLITLTKGEYWRFQEAACEAIDAFLADAGITLTQKQPAEKEGDADGDLPF